MLWSKYTECAYVGTRESGKYTLRNCPSKCRYLFGLVWFGQVPNPAAPLIYFLKQAFPVKGGRVS